MPRGGLSLLNLSLCEIVKRKIMMTNSSIDGIKNNAVSTAPAAGDGLLQLAATGITVLHGCVTGVQLHNRMSQ